MPKFYYFVFYFFAVLLTLDASSQKRLFCKINRKHHIDGETNKHGLQTQHCHDFIMFEPDNGKPINENKRQK
jgi:hypothetical protein